MLLHRVSSKSHRNRTNLYMSHESPKRFSNGSFIRLAKLTPCKRIAQYEGQPFVMPCGKELAGEPGQHAQEQEETGSSKAGKDDEGDLVVLLLCQLQYGKDKD